LDKHLHIVTHEVPWPVDYGGVVDLFYKIKSLSQSGIKIHLHCYTHNREEQPILNRFCVSVDYYPRKDKWASLSTTLPYIVASRSDENLLNRLKQDEHPIFLDGIHCTYFLYKGLLKGRRVFVRPHNIEARYYKRLANWETNLLKKMYFHTESILLNQYEKKLARMATFWPVSLADTAFYHKQLDCIKVDFLPVFVPWDEVKTLPGKGSFCLYHGNLEVNENARAAEWLLNNVFNTLEIPFVVAGNNPSLPLQSLAHRHQHTCIVVNPSEHEMQDLIRKAQINIIPSFNNTGVKLKLINALFNGRHCLINEEAGKGSGVEQLCHVVKDAKGFQNAIGVLFKTAISEQDIIKRQDALLDIYNNQKNAAQLTTWIY